MSDSSEGTLILEQFLPYRLSTLARNVSQQYSLEYRDRFNLSIPEWRILARLGQCPNSSATELGMNCAMDKSKVSRVLKDLEVRGLVIKRTAASDKRASMISLTDKGQDIYQQIVPLVLNWESSLLNTLTASEYRDLMKILFKLDERLIELSAQKTDSTKDYDHKKVTPISQLK